MDQKYLVMLETILTIGHLFWQSAQAIEKQSLTFCEDFSDACYEKTTPHPLVVLTGIKIPDLDAIQKLTTLNLTSPKTQFCTTGIWAQYTKPNYKGSWSIGTASCTTATTEREHLKSLRFIGNPDLSLPGISLYSGNRNAGVPVGDETYVDGTKTNQTSFKHPLCVSYWGLSSNQSWTIYSGKKWTGNSTCLVPVSADYGWGGLEYISVGSIRLGCHSNYSTNSDLSPEKAGHEVNFVTCT